MAWIFLLTAVVSTVLGQSFLKLGAAAGSVTAQFTDPRTLAGIATYGFSALFYILALRRIPLSVAMPCTALSYIAVVLIGHYGFNEPLGMQRVLALALITGGVLVLATS